MDLTGSKWTREALPVAALLLAASMWGLIWWPLRALEHHGLAGLWTALVSFGAAALPGLAVLWRGRAQLARAPVATAVLALASGWCNVSFIIAVLHGTVVRVLLLFYLSPVWATLLGWLLLRERLTRRTWAVLALAMTGVVFMNWDPGLSRPWPREAADWLAVSAGLAFALSNVMVRRLTIVSVPVKTAVTWVGVAAVAAGGLLWHAGPAVPAVVPAVWLGAAALGWFGIAVMTVLVQYGVTHMPVQRSAVIMLFELVVGASASQVLTSEVVTAREWLGGCFILAAAYLAARAQQEPSS